MKHYSVPNGKFCEGEVESIPITESTLAGRAHIVGYDASNPE